MVTCQDVNAFLADYLDGAVEADLARRFEEHISRCSQCTAYLDQYRKTISYVTEAGREPAPPPDPLIENTLDFLRRRLDENAE